MARDDSVHWLDVEEIGEMLHERHPEKDPVRIGFVELKQLVLALPDFKERPGHPCNEKILEHIQAAWINEKSGKPKREED